MFDKKNSWAISIGVTLLVALIVINVLLLGTQVKYVDVKFSTELSSTIQNNASITFMPDNLIINTIDKSGRDGQIDIWNSNISISGYSDTVEIYSLSYGRITLSNVQFFLNETNINMDIFFSRYTQFTSCEVIELPSQITIKEEKNIIVFNGGQTKYKMEVVGDPLLGLWEYNFRFWSNSEGTIKLAEECLGYIPDSYVDYSLSDILSFKLDGNRSILDVTVETHSITFDNDLVMSADAGSFIVANGLYGDITMTANTNDSKIIENNIRDTIYGYDDLMIISRDGNSSLELKAFVTEYGDIEIKLYGNNAEVLCNDKKINHFEFNYANNFTKGIFNIGLGCLTIISFYDGIKNHKKNNE